ncbi:MAG: ELWxxDGT repeat protein [Planctomycetota bacterium]
MKDIAPTPGASSFRGPLTAVGCRAFFAADDGEHGRELWVTDGTEPGTRLVADIRPGAEGSWPEILAPAGNLLYFAANDGEHGLELWALPLSGSLLSIAPVIPAAGEAHVVLAAEEAVCGFSFGLRLEAACAGAWIREVLPGPDLPEATERWEASVAPDGQSAWVSSSLGLDDSGAVLGPGSELKIARVALCRGAEAPGACTLYFADDVGAPPVPVAVQHPGGAASTPVASCAPLERAFAACFRRGDANGDGARHISDPVFVLYWLFGENVASCLDASDANDDGRVDVSDPVYHLRFLFAGGPPPPAPGPFDCGPDETADDLGCEAYAACR